MLTIAKEYYKKYIVYGTKYRVWYNKSNQSITFNKHTSQNKETAQNQNNKDLEKEIIKKKL